MPAEEEEEEEEEISAEEDTNDSDYSDNQEETTKTKKRSSKNNRVSSIDSDDSDANPFPIKRTTARRKPKKSTKMSKQLLDLRRKREQTVRTRNEELAAAKQQEENLVEDRKHAEAIAARFETNTEEARERRVADRIGLLEKLTRKKREALVLDDSTLEISKKEEVKPRLTANKGIHVNLDSDSSDNDTSDDSDSEDDLEIIPICTQPSEPQYHKKPIVSPLDKTLSGDIITRSTSLPRRSLDKVPSNPRALLRNKLNNKRVHVGNSWLAKELGYKNEEDHIRDCKAMEAKRKEKARRDEVRKLNILKADLEMEELGEKETEDEEEDEELAMAKQVEVEKGGDKQDELKTSKALNVIDECPNVESMKESVIEIDSQPETHAKVGDEEIRQGNEDQDDIMDNDDLTDRSQSTIVPEEINTEEPVERLPSSDLDSPEANDGNLDNSEEACESQLTPITRTYDTTNPTIINSKDLTKQDLDAPSKQDKPNNEKTENILQNNNTIPQEDSTPPPQKQKNAAWKALLAKEAKSLARSKSSRLVEDQAEEEEEDVFQQGLQDFGFSVPTTKKDDNEDEHIQVSKDDLENVVDELSDDEGDEEAGQVARKEMEEKEEKERHKEILRRMREGYDGRRGGIASGGARGLHRFDQLVAADNRKDAKRLGLLNDDEMDSDDEGEKDDKNDEEEDETALLDQMIKERYMREENEILFQGDVDSSDEEEQNEDEQKQDVDELDEEDFEQKRLAKRFAKRARMNRVIEAYGESQFSKSRLMEEDESIKSDLLSIKSVNPRKRQISTTSTISSSTDQSHSQSQSAHSLIQRQRSITSSVTGALSIALRANRRKKSKTSFLSGREHDKSNKRSITSKSLTLSHVVFTYGASDNGQSQGGLSQLSQSQSSKSNSGGRRHLLGSASLPSGVGVGSKTMSRTNSVVGASKSTSLWSKVSSNGFRRR